MFRHRDLIDEKVHRPGYFQATDPGAVGAGKVWIDTTAGAGAWVQKIRNLADSGWETIGGGGGGGAPTTADYLVGTAQGGLSAEIVVGATPGGELGGTWGSPTVDATHSGTAHHAQSHASAHLNGGADLLALPATINFLIDGGGAVLTTGVKGDLVIDFACTITKWTLLGDQSGSIVVDLWKDTYANFPPVIGDVITASAKPTITTATKGQSSTLTGWTTAIAAGDVLRFNINSVTTIQRVLLALTVTRA